MAPDYTQGLSLQMNQRMEMVMTPQMIQSMEMLQLPLMALEQRIQQELLENPALELVDLEDDADSFDSSDAADNDSGTDSGSSADSESAGEKSPAVESDDFTSDDSPDYLADNGEESLSRIDEVDFEWDDYYDDSAPRRGFEDDEERFDLIENTAASEISLAQHLEEQLSFLELPEVTLACCNVLIYRLAHNGYLDAPLEEILAQNPDLDATADDMEEALLTVQELDPPGIGARDLRECLLLQLDRLGPEHTFTRMLVENYLEDVAANRLPKISRALSCTIDDVKLGINDLRTLNPNPGLQFAPSQVTAARADLIAEMNDNGEWDITLPSGSRPEISETFLALFDTTKHGKALREKLEQDADRSEEFKRLRELLRRGEEGRQLREKYQSARWLLTAIAQRERTLYRVAVEVVDVQSSYLSGQDDAPAPLMMQEVADRIGIDISTVCRAVHDKYMQTPLGLLPLRNLFTRAVGGSDNDGKKSSNVHIMNRIREMIEAEDKTKPLKDDQIQDMLKEQGIEIQRRTVAKYRDNLGYLSHSKRRTY